MSKSENFEPKSEHKSEPAPQEPAKSPVLLGVLFLGLPLLFVILMAVFQDK